MQKNFNSNKNIYIYAAIYIILRPLVLIIMPSFLHIMLGFNVFLSLIPLFFSTLLLQKFKSSKTVTLIMIFIFWLLFFPNTFYMLTDFIHLQNFKFYTTDDSSIYIRNIKYYVGLADIIFGVIIGVLAGLKSLIQIHRLYLMKFKKIISNLLLTCTVFVSSIGIYIGRFLRFYSWNILKPITLMKDFFNSLDLFSLYFIVLFCFMNIAIYYIYYSSLSIKQLNEIDSYLYENLESFKIKKDQI